LVYGIGIRAFRVRLSGTIWARSPDSVRKDLVGAQAVQGHHMVATEAIGVPCGLFRTGRVDTARELTCRPDRRRQVRVS
jgi:hypothetical protein